MESGEGKSGSGSGTGRSKRGGDGDTRIGSGNGFGAIPHDGVDRGRHREGGVPGSQWFQRGGVEQGGGMSLLRTDINQDNIVPTLTY